MRDEQRAVWAKCESPIEQFLCVALFEFLGCCAVAGDYGTSRLPELAAIAGGDPAAFLFSQQPVGKYRMDFLCAAVNPRTKRARLLGIECDGKAYHSNPEQKERDRIRQRRIMGAVGPGFTIVRFSGGELRHSMKRAVEHVAAWMRAADVEPIEQEGAWLIAAHTPGYRVDTRQPYRDEAAEDEALRVWFQTEGFV